MIASAAAGPGPSRVERRRPVYNPGDENPGDDDTRGMSPRTAGVSSLVAPDERRSDPGAPSGV